jgi:hypothetical protein
MLIQQGESVWRTKFLQRYQKAYIAVIVAQLVGLKLAQALQQADPRSQ